MARLTVPLVFVTSVACFACGTASKPPASTPSSQLQSSVAAQSETQKINDRYVAQIKQVIGAREGEPAAQVFKNIQVLKTAPAGRLLLIMNVGYSRALGVTCLHCHVENDFASDEKRPKRAAREMAGMHRMINEQLRGMANLEDDPSKRAINCSTCHRGAVDPRTTDR